LSGNCIAIDIGCSSVKVIAGKLNGKNIGVKAEKTLTNKPLALNGHLYIDVYQLYDSIKNAIRQLSKNGCKFDSIGIDTYGNGYGIFDKDMSMIGLPFFYKDSRTQGILSKITQIVALREIYQQTGVYPTDIRVLVQLYYETMTKSTRIENGKHLLLLPDLFGYFLTGVKRAERSMASVANLLSRRNDDWCFELMQKLSIPTDIFPPLVEGGREDDRSSLLPEVMDELQCKNIRLACVTSHDTESALLAAPMLDNKTLFVSLGSSVICGAQTTMPIICDTGFTSGFKNMYGAFGSNSLCRDFNGLWMLEQCMELWRNVNPHISYSDVIHSCESAGENHTFFDVCDSSFRFYKGTLIEAIKEYCLRTDQPIVNSVGEIANCILESIALQIKWTYAQIKQVIGRSDFHGISIVGGGVRNPLLMQMISDALGLPLYRGSPFSASMGNILMQNYAAHELNSLEEIKEVACNSCDMRIITPVGLMDRWDTALSRMEKHRLILREEEEI
jgi:sugar (pentulose or hexulose) kinase